MPQSNETPRSAIPDALTPTGKPVADNEWISTVQVLGGRPMTFDEETWAQHRMGFAEPDDLDEETATFDIANLPTMKMKAAPKPDK